MTSSSGRGLVPRPIGCGLGGPLRFNGRGEVIYGRMAVNKEDRSNDLLANLAGRMHCAVPRVMVPEDVEALRIIHPVWQCWPEGSARAFRGIPVGGRDAAL